MHGNACACMYTCSMCVTVPGLMFTIFLFSDCGQDCPISVTFAWLWLANEFSLFAGSAFVGLIPEAGA